MAQRSGLPFLWVTWIAGFLAGDQHCDWAPWYKAHFFYKKRHEGFDLSVWKAEHSKWVRSRAEALTEDGWTVSIEDQNRFKVVGKTAEVSGCPDLIAIKGDAYRVEDVKTGQRRNSDLWQVRSYLALLPMSDPLISLHYVMTAAVFYSTTAEFVPVEPETDRVITGIQQLAVPGSLRKVPSFQECRFCDIADCDDRITTESSTVQTDLF